MKKIVLIVSAIMMVANMDAATVANTSNASSETSIENIATATSPFTETVLNVPAHVRFVIGKSYAVSVKSNDEEIAKAVKFDVKNGVLVFDAVNNSEEYSESVEIVITAPAMPEVKAGRDFIANVK
ncbi:MAG: hypothetical protein MJZ41_13115 [Bacteroidaceae bacterium]|nr:hypothetical protein [Bacteroidaceae bacterium]